MDSSVVLTLCHNTGTGGEKYYSGTAVELAECAAAQGSNHFEWQQLSVVGGAANAGMLMSGGLCLDTAARPAPESALAAAAGDTSNTLPMQPRVNPREEAAARDWKAAALLGLLSGVRVTVTTTNGVPNAHITEIRLYGEDGVSPFPIRP
jgi:hypothetical protein